MILIEYFKINVWINVFLCARVSPIVTFVFFTTPFFLFSFKHFGLFFTELQTFMLKRPVQFEWNKHSFQSLPVSIEKSTSPPPPPIIIVWGVAVQIVVCGMADQLTTKLAQGQGGEGWGLKEKVSSTWIREGVVLSGVIDNIIFLTQE